MRELLPLIILAVLVLIGQASEKAHKRRRQQRVPPPPEPPAPPPTPRRVRIPPRRVPVESGGEAPRNEREGEEPGEGDAAVAAPAEGSEATAARDRAHEGKGTSVEQGTRRRGRAMTRLGGGDKALAGRDLLKAGVLWSEVLGPPRAIRGPHRPPHLDRGPLAR